MPYNAYVFLQGTDILTSCVLSCADRRVSLFLKEITKQTTQEVAIKSISNPCIRFVKLLGNKLDFYIPVILNLT